jgi:uncharacterized protein (DUF1697 family)
VTTWVALLRGINLGSHKRVAMADLRTLLGSLGYGDVRTHLQSGNALFTAGRTTGAELGRQIADRLEADLGLDVAVLVRTADELGAVVAENPFVAEGVAPRELHAAFLSAAPSARKAAGLDPGAYAPDRFELGERVVYLHLPNGVMGSRLPDWERVLDRTVTQRSWNTVTRLHALCDG